MVLDLLPRILSEAYPFLASGKIGRDSSSLGFGVDANVAEWGLVSRLCGVTHCGVCEGATVGGISIGSLLFTGYCCACLLYSAGGSISRSGACSRTLECI